MERMTNKFINKIQKKILELLPEGKINEKGLLLQDSCSELSRLVTSWIKDEEKFSHQIILKGDNVCNTIKSHDIIAHFQNGKVYIIDPTIWQFFPNKKTILLGEYSSLDDAIVAISKEYGGQWQKAEVMDEDMYKEKSDWLAIIKANIDEELMKSKLSNRN